MTARHASKDESVWVRDKRTGGIVGYFTPDRRLVRLANASALYARYLRMTRERQPTSEESRDDT